MIKTIGRKAFAAAIVMLALLAHPATAQDAVILSLPADPDYTAATRYRNIQSELFYVDRRMGPLDMEQMPDPPSIADQQAPTEGFFGQVSVNLNTALLLAFFGIIGWLIYKYGRRARDGFVRAGTDRRNGTARMAQSDDPRREKRPRTQDLIARLLDMEDREAAMVELIHHVLDAAASQHDLRLGRSETSRDFLRRLPENWTHLADLRRIVIAEELVQFGGRPLVSRNFEDCLRRATPILDGVRA